MILKLMFVEKPLGSYGGESARQTGEHFLMPSIGTTLPDTDSGLATLRRPFRALRSCHCCYSFLWTLTVTSERRPRGRSGRHRAANDSSHILATMPDWGHSLRIERVRDKSASFPIAPIRCPRVVCVVMRIARELWPAILFYRG